MVSNISEKREHDGEQRDHHTCGDREQGGGIEHGEDGLADLQPSGGELTEAFEHGVEIGTRLTRGDEADADGIESDRVPGHRLAERHALFDTGAHIVDDFTEAGMAALALER